MSTCLAPKSRGVPTAHRVVDYPWAPEISSPFLPSFRASGFHFPLNCRLKMGRERGEGGRGGEGEGEGGRGRGRGEEGARNFEQNMHFFLQCALFPVQEAHLCKTMSQTTCIVGPPPGCFIWVFECSHFDVFYIPKKAAQNKKGGSKSASRIEISIP